MPSTIRIGSRGYDVALAQCRLQAGQPEVAVDGVFGLKTQSAVIAFQRRAGIHPDGVVGSATHAALAKGPEVTIANHRIALIPQPTASTCWAASTAMMTGTTVDEVIAKTPAAMLVDGGGLGNSSETDQAIVTGDRYAALHRLRCHAPMSWSCKAFAQAACRGPLMLDMLWNTANYTRGAGSSGHMVVVSAMMTVDASQGPLYLQVLDPWPPRQGKIAWVEYGQWMTGLPTRTYRVFERT